jgi:hypothetical protein
VLPRALASRHLAKGRAVATRRQPWPADRGRGAGIDACGTPKAGRNGGNFACRLHCGQRLCGFARTVRRRACPPTGQADAICAIAGARRQERHSIKTATPSSSSTMTPSPMIPSLVGRFMIKSSGGKTGESEPQEKGPGEVSRAFAAFRGPRGSGPRGPVAVGDH